MEVLVVDDDPLTRTLMKRMLSRMGCQVSTAENGEVALEMILGAAHTSDSHNSFVPADPLSGAAFVPAEDQYAVVFLDNQMPVMSGLKAVEKLRDLGRQDFVVGITGEHRPSRSSRKRTYRPAGNALLTDQKEYLDAGADQ
jgi:CheY-like chemotaxis protein